MNPFAQLLGATPGRLLTTTSATLVMQGKRMPKGRRLTQSEQSAILEGDDPQDHQDQMDSIAAARRKAASRARHKRYRSKPEAQAKEKARNDANRERRAALRRAWEERNRDKLRAYKAEWQRKARKMRPELAAADRARSIARQRQLRQTMTPEQAAARREYQRQYRQANRDRINAKTREWKARKAAELAAKEGGAS
jgi:colicin import membrane protein